MLPYYLAIGMSAEEFWRGEPFLARAYVKAQEIKTDLANQNMWLQGMYFYTAVGTALANGFSKGGKRQKYPEKPFNLHPKVDKPITEDEAEKERQRIANYLRGLVKKQKQQKRKQKEMNESGCRES